MPVLAGIPRSTGELYLPEPWVADRDRCRQEGNPGEVELETKPRQAMAMPAQAFETKVPFAWVTADEVYGQVKCLRLWLEAHDAAHVLATKVNDTLVTTGGTEARADELISALPGRSWRRLTVGAHGPREWLAEVFAPDATDSTGRCAGLARAVRRDDESCAGEGTAGGRRGEVAAVTGGDRGGS